VAVKVENQSMQRVRMRVKPMKSPRVKRVPVQVQVQVQDLMRKMMTAVAKILRKMRIRE
jgi:hypothetical protein